ncbi:MAG: hypothetical protein WAV28_10920 [Sedimentisphaerales bacterium]
MKHSGTTKIFVIVWASALFASYVTGVCIREVRFKHARVASQAVTEPQVNSEVQPPSATDQLVKELAQKRPMPGPEGAEGPRNLSPEDRAGFGEGRANMRERLDNMSEEEREQFRAQMRERFAGRRREGGAQNLSEEDRAKMREETEKLRERWEEMSEEEREAARAQMIERYGFAPRIGQGGNRGPGSEEGGRRRQGGRQQENN